MLLEKEVQAVKPQTTFGSCTISCSSHSSEYFSTTSYQVL
jgi:hypothetical protein